MGTGFSPARKCELLPGCRPSAPEVDGGDLLALVPQLPADYQPGLTIMGFLLRGEHFASKPAISGGAAVVGPGNAHRGVPGPRVYAAGAARRARRPGPPVSGRQWGTILLR